MGRYNTWLWQIRNRSGGGRKTSRQSERARSTSTKKHQTLIKSVKQKIKNKINKHIQTHYWTPKKTIKTCKKHMENTWKNPSSPSIFLCLLSLELHPLDLPLGGHLQRLGLGLRTGWCLLWFITINKHKNISFIITMVYYYEFHYSWFIFFTGYLWISWNMNWMRMRFSMLSLMWWCTIEAETEVSAVFTSPSSSSSFQGTAHRPKTIWVASCSFTGLIPFMGTHVAKRWAQLDQTLALWTYWCSVYGWRMACSWLPGSIGNCVAVCPARILMPSFAVFWVA